MNILVIHHSADFDGIACREVARFWLEKKLNTVTTKGWDYSDDPLDIERGKYDQIFILDLSPSCLEDFIRFNVVWIDHHKTSIDNFESTKINGYRVDGVAACRLAWQWFASGKEWSILPKKQEYVDRRVDEPPLIRMLGEYDVWDHRDQECRLLQFGLHAIPFQFQSHFYSERTSQLSDIQYLVDQGRIIERYQKAMDVKTAGSAGLVRWKGLDWIMLNAPGNSQLFETAVPQFKHDALMRWTADTSGRAVVSLYHSPGKEHLDLSVFAKEMGGGGHRGACGFSCDLSLIQTIIAESKLIPQFDSSTFTE